MESVFDDLSKALEGKRNNARVAVTLLVLAGIVAVGLGIVIALDGRPTSEIRQSPHNLKMWGERHVVG